MSRSWLLKAFFAYDNAKYQIGIRYVTKWFLLVNPLFTIYLYFPASHFCISPGLLRYWLYFSDNPCGVIHYVYTHDAQALPLQFD